MRRLLLVVSCLAFSLMLAMACWPSRRGHPATQVGQIEVDTTALVVRVFNQYKRTPVTAYLDAVFVGRRRLSEILPEHEAYLMVPSSSAKGVSVFFVVLEPTDHSLRPHYFGPIVRNPNRITMVFVSVGDSLGTGGPQS